MTSDMCGSGFGRRLGGFTARDTRDTWGLTYTEANEGTANDDWGRSLDRWSRYAHVTEGKCVYRFSEAREPHYTFCSMNTIPLGDLWTWTLVRADWCDVCSQAINGRAAVEASMGRTLCSSCVFDLGLAPLDVHAPLSTADPR